MKRSWIRVVLPVIMVLAVLFSLSIDVCGRVLLKGKVLEQGRARELRDADIVKKAYLSSDS
ncbi:MAG: hypothetical protein JRH06_09980 [Deltaproteobacteria bacterium]|nr:hypothetical protein [Deltaproteobacteria bacterium]MBW2137872.1 hypothetical protein [Deltaproteobacteria bacterium]